MTRQPETSTNDTRITRLVWSLRRLQETFADRPREERGQRLAEEIHAELEGFPQHERPTILLKLKEHFPAFNGAPGSMHDSATGGSAANGSLIGGDAPTIGTTAASYNMPEPDSQSIIELRNVLGLKDDAPIDPDRVYQLATLLIKTVDRLDALALSALNEIRRTGGAAPAAAPPKPLTSVLKQWIRGKEDTLLRRVDQFRMRTGKLVRLLPVCGDYAQNLVEKQAPDRVEQIVRTEGGWGFKSLPEKCWAKYEVLAKDFANDGFKRRLNARIREEVEKNV